MTAAWSGRCLLVPAVRWKEVSLGGHPLYHLKPSINFCGHPLDHPAPCTLSWGRWQRAGSQERVLSYLDRDSEQTLPKGIRTVPKLVRSHSLWGQRRDWPSFSVVPTRVLECGKRPGAGCLKHVTPLCFADYHMTSPMPSCIGLCDRTGFFVPSGPNAVTHFAVNEGSARPALWLLF